MGMPPGMRMPGFGMPPGMPPMSKFYAFNYIFGI